MQRAAVIGAGMIAKQHLGALRATPGVEVVSVCDLSPVMAESTADRFGVADWRTDYREVLGELSPDVVHITTPASSHFRIASDCLEAGASVFVEKPITTTLEEFERLAELAEARGLWLIEDHNYRFNDDVASLLSDHKTGVLGEVRHVEVQVNLQLFGAGSRFADQDAPHPAMGEPLGAVSDFLTHLAYLAHAFVGPHRHVSVTQRQECGACPNAISEFKALVEAERGTALLGLSCGSEIDGFWLRVEGSRERAEVNLFEVGRTATRAIGGPQPLAPVRNLLARSRSERRNAWRSLSRKLSGGPGPYEGLWRLVEETYAARAAGGPPPIAVEEVREVNAMTHAITAAAVRRGEVGSPCEC